MSMVSVRVRGGASAEELAAVVAVLTHHFGAVAEPDAAARWRATRLAAIRSSAARERHHTLRVG